MEQTTGDWAGTKDGVLVRFPVFCRNRRTIRRTPMGWLLFGKARRSSLAVQFGEKGLFLQRIAGAQQFQERILRVGSGAARLA